MILAALALAGLVQNDPATDPAGAAALMHQVLSVSQELSLQRSVRGLTYAKSLTSYNIDDEQRPIEEETRTWSVRASGTGTISQPLTKNGEPAHEPEKPDFDMLEAMRAGYRYRWAPEPETGTGDDRCFNIIFEPMNPDADASSIEERIANHLTGTACIAVDGLFVRRIEAHLFEPFKVKFGVKMKRVHLSIDFRLIDGLPVYERSRTDAHYAVFGFDSVKRADMVYSNWQMHPTVIAPAP